jgi:hypothetical protein
MQKAAWQKTKKGNLNLGYLNVPISSFETYRKIGKARERKTQTYVDPRPKTK